MRERQGFQLRDYEDSLPKGLIQSKSLNRLRKSLDNAQNMRLDLFRLRKSVSNTSLECHLHRAIKANPIHSVLPRYQMPMQRSVGSSQLSDRLQEITRKLMKAKLEILGSEESARTIRKSSKQLEQAQSYETKQSLLQTDRSKQKSPLLTYTSATIKPQNIRPFSRNPYSIRGSRYYLGQAVRAMNQKNSLVMEHISQSMQMLLQYRLFKINQQNLSQQENIILHVSEECRGRKTLVLDMDETLLHCFQRSQGEADIRLTVSIDGQGFEIGMNLRPYAISFLKKMRRTWEIVIFTASQQEYADAILDQIDPDGILFHHRLYRQHCRELTPQLYIKDLSRLNRDPRKIVLVDNSAYSYSMQLENGIPILPFYEGKDYELAALQSYLHGLQSCEDVREVNREYFKLGRYTNFDNSFDLVKDLYNLTP